MSLGVPLHEWATIRRIAFSVGVDPFLLIAIRRQENGRPGREFGILMDSMDTFEKQARACAVTLSRYLFEYEKNPLFRITTAQGKTRLCYTPAFIEYAARRYAPIGAANDPTHLNEHWARSVSLFYSDLTKNEEVV